MKPNIELQIEELVLQGISAGDRDQIRTAVEAELARMFVEEGMPGGLSQPCELPRIQGATISLTSNHKVNDFGSQIASAVYRSLPQ